MARTKTTHDIFNAVAEPKRRELIEILAGKEKSVNQLVEQLDWNQPMVSKHLSVLKQVGLVSERKDGRYRVYQVNFEQLQPIQDWVKQFESHWNQQFDQLDKYLTQLQSDESTMDAQSDPKESHLPSNTNKNRDK